MTPRTWWVVALSINHHACAACRLSSGFSPPSGSSSVWSMAAWSRSPCWFSRNPRNHRDDSAGPFCQTALSIDSRRASDDGTSLQRIEAEPRSSSFSTMLAAERGARPNTLSAYRSDLDEFDGHLATTGSRIVSATTDDIRSYLRRSDTARTGAGIGRTENCRPSVSSIASSMRKAIAATIRQRSLKVQSAAARCPKVMSISDVDRLIGTAREQADRSEQSVAEKQRTARLCCLLELLYATGLRVSELVAIAGIRFKTRPAHADGKRQRRQGSAWCR